MEETVPSTIDTNGATKEVTVDPARTSLEIESVGEHTDTIHVELSTRFLEHFSEQLYSSPQKAFEELISNSWDAGSDFVDVRISGDLSDPGATMCVLDNGTSMDAIGLQELWHIAFSPKRGNPVQNGRPVIGKFGIGKLATYVLASKLTYICKGSDGVIRRVTMDYGDIERQQGVAKDKLISDLTLNMFELSESELRSALAGVYGGDALLESIESGVNPPAGTSTEGNEFGGCASELSRTQRDTWTLVVLSDLKPVGKELKLHVLRRMLQAALPFGSEMTILVNGDRLSSSKVSAAVSKEWIIGPTLGFDSIEIDAPHSGSEEEPTNPESKPEEKEAPKEKISIILAKEPFPHADIPGVGKVTGTIRLFDEKISGGKSDERGASNGFHVNVLGRVVNQGDPSFGEENLSHASWARFRMAVRADGLNELLTTSREQFKERRETKVFRAFLRKAFNHARSFYDSDANLGMPDGGDLLVKSLGMVSLSPLRNVVSDTLAGKAPLTGLFDEKGIEDREKKRAQWRESTADNIKSALSSIKYEKSEDNSFVKFRIDDNSIIVNNEHPFVVEHSRSRAEKEVVRTVAMITLLSDVYALDIGVDPKLLSEVRNYRDKLFRFKAMQRRKSGTYIANLLLQTQHESDTSKKMEVVVSDALRYLGFHVKDLAKSGEPEGIASAYSLPTSAEPTEDNPNPPLYSFAFDAKSSKHDVAATGNIKLDGVVQHRTKYKADYSLIVAPGFQEGSLSERCLQQKVTPIKARDLGRLLHYTATYGAIALVKLRELFSFHDPDDVSVWVDGLDTYLRSNRKLTFDVFLQALKLLKDDTPDVLSASTIATICRRELKVATVREIDVKALVAGLQILVPDLIAIDDDKVVVNASADLLAEAVRVQLERIEVDPE